MTARPLRVVDLFSGAGGWSEGARAAGASVLACVNHWPAAIACHSANHPSTDHLLEDATRLDPMRLPPHDVLLASPACQGHSRARGAERPHHDAQRATAWCVVSVAEAHRPRLLAVENVPEMATWTLFGAWRSALEALGYALTVQVLDAADFGVPQNRRRLVVLGSLKRAPAATRPVTSRHAPAAGLIDWTLPMRRIDIGRPLAARTLQRIEAGRAAHGRRFLLSYYGATRGGRSLDRPLGTVTTKERWALVDGDRLRMLSVDEYRAAMGFPAHYRLPGSKAEQVKLLGNAVCPPMAAAVVRQLAEAVQ